MEDFLCPICFGSVYHPEEVDHGQYGFKLIICEKCGVVFSDAYKARRTALQLQEARKILKSFPF